MKTSPWIVIDGYCACRTIEGGDFNNVLDRIAFIEKSPRVRIGEPESLYVHLIDMDKWEFGPKGNGGNGDPEKDELYGFDKESRAWCDEMLIILGYELG